MKRWRVVSCCIRNVWRKAKLLLFCILGFFCVAYLNPGNGMNIVTSLDQYRMLTLGLNITSPHQTKSIPRVIKIPDGFDLSQDVWLQCPLQNESMASQALKPTNQITVRYNKERDVMLCPIYKVGSTFWRRIFMMLVDKRYQKVKHPYEIPFDKEFGGAHFKIGTDRQSKFTFMFTREPYSRLFSTYIDKLLAPNPYYWKVLGDKIVKLTRSGNKPRRPGLSGHDVTFPEFIKYVIFSLSNKKDVDPHFVRMDENCRPCDIHYDFIGKMENFAKDSLVCLEKLNLGGVAEILQQNGSDLSARDAMLDTVSQPFTFKSKYLRYITFSDALQRAWKKLQIRGLIGEDPLDLSVYGRSLEGVTVGRIMSRAMDSRKRTSSHARKMLKESYYRTYWKQIDIDDLNSIHSLYANDFKIFKYDDKPFAVFQNRTK